MELFSRSKSSPHLEKVDDVTYVVIAPDTLSDVECTEEEEEEDMSEVDDDKSTDNENVSLSEESVNNTLLSPDVHSYMSESEASPILHRKKRRAPLPPDMSPTMAARHSYAFDMEALRLRTSTDTESTTSESRLFYQTSTDSETIVIPESARGSNFPGELAGVENLHTHRALRPLRRDIPLSQTPRLSKFTRLRDVFRSPQIGRRKTIKHKSNSGKSSRLRTIQALNGNLSAVIRSKAEDGSKSPRPRNSRNFDPIPEMSDCILISGCDGLEADQEFDVKRIPDYEKYLSELLEATDSSHVDYEEISKCLKKVRSMMKELDNNAFKEDESVMDTTELRSTTDNLSPETGHVGKNSTDNNSITENSINNNNNNNEDNANKSREVSQRRKSAPSAVLFRTTPITKYKSPTSIWYNAGLGKRDPDVTTPFKLADGESTRTFIMEGSVQFAEGMQRQERYLFLFGDLLLVTKQKSNTTFKLKHKVQLCDMWIASCIEDVSEITRPADRSFVLGWPTTNVVATFPTVRLKDDWLTKLSENITKEKLKDEDKSVQLKVALRDIEAVPCQTCQLTINNFTQAKDVLLDCLKQINISESEAKDYQLWVLSGKEGSAYPLIGHETPFSIKLNQVRELSRSKSANELDNMTAAELETVMENSPSSGQRPDFYLKQKRPQKKNRFEDSPVQKQMKKVKKTPKIFNTMFRKKRAAQRLVFGLPLSEICDDNNDPPEAIIKLMVLVYQQGPHTPGILRKGNNAALGKELKEKIDSGEKYILEDHMVLTAASVFKEFLRCLPDGLLTHSLHDQWLTVKKDDSHEEKINKIKTILGQLPPQNYYMIKLTICLLQHLAKHSSINHMGPSNLATCIAPSFYTPGTNGSPHEKLKGDIQRQMQNSITEIQNIIGPLIAFLITNHVEIFGPDTLNMFVKYGCEPSPMLNIDEDRYDSQMQPSADEDEEEDMVGEGEFDEHDEHFSDQFLKNQHRLQIQQRKQHMLRDSNSGTDSDSMHSVLSMQDAGVGLQRDDSSIDSLGERDYYPHENPKAISSHLSPSNLSRDSGLTLSDNQLYDEEYPADIGNASVKLFQPRLLHFTDHNDIDHRSFSQGVNVHFDKGTNPIPPPRKRSIKKKLHAKQSEVSELAQRATLHHSASTTQLDDSQSVNRHREQRTLLTHSSLDKKVSSDSIGEEEAVDNQPQPIDFQSMREGTDIGTLIKSENGAQLFLNEESLPTKFSLRASEGQSENPFMRQLSGDSSVVPVSPESCHSQSSSDSIISDSACSTSRDGSIYSAPPTPDEPDNKALNWVPDISLPGKPWQRILADNLDIQQLSAHGKSISDLLVRKKVNLDDLTIENSSPGKVHETKDTEVSGEPHFSFMDPQSSYSKNSPTSPTSLSQSGVPYGKQRFSTHHNLGSPPPKVLLQTLQSSARTDFVPLRPGVDSTAIGQMRCSSTDSLDTRHQGIAKEMLSIRPEECINVKSKPVILTPEGGFSNSALGSSSRGKLSKYISPKIDLHLSPKDRDFVSLLSKQSQIRPLNYNQAMQNNFTMKYNLPADVTEIQREKSARAKEIYEKSLKLYNEQSPTIHLNGQSADDRSNPNVFLSSNLAHHLKNAEIDGSLDSTLSATTNLEGGHSDYSDSFWPALAPGKADHRGASEFLESESPSHSPQEDTLSRGNKFPESNAGSVSRSMSVGGLVSLSQNDSKHSDTGSSGGSSVTISPLSTHDSFGRRSDLSNTSNITISSATSSDSNSEVGSTLPKQRSLTMADLPSSLVEHTRRSDSDLDIDMIENDETDDIYAMQRKKPEELYLKSMQLYEQNSSTGASSTVQSINKQPINPSFSNSSQPRQVASFMLKTPSNQTALLSFTQQTNSPIERSIQSMSRLSLEGPTSKLQRSRSDSADRVQRIGAYSPHSRKTSHDNSKEIKQPLHANSDNSSHTKVKSKPCDMVSEYHQNFLRAKSCFHQTEVAKHTLSGISSHSPPSFQGSESTEATAESTSAQRQQVPYVHPSNSSQRASKSEFNWSVKDLKTIYDRSNDSADGKRDNTNKSTSQISSHPDSPSPFRRHPDSPHQSTSSSGSDRMPSIQTTKKAASQRQGPQSYFHEASYSSSDDSYSSSPERRQTWLSGSSLDSEEISDYTNTTYI